jgi:hypothetical protein
MPRSWLNVKRKGAEEAMSNLKTIVGVLVAVVVAFGAVQASASSTPTAIPAGGSPDGGWHRSANVTFTKWVTSLPGDPSTMAGISMAGVVGGDVGPGVFAGKVIRDDTTSKPGFWLAQALYGFNGSKHSFVAYNFVTENDTTSPVTATIRGVVIQGWMRGARVTGEYMRWDTCPIPTPGNVFGSVCFQGTLHLQLGHGN